MRQGHVDCACESSGHMQKEVIETLIQGKQAMTPITFFATPESMAELEKWLADAKDPMVTTAAMMMYNLLTSQYDMVAKK